MVNRQHVDPAVCFRGQDVDLSRHRRVVAIAGDVPCRNVQHQVKLTVGEVRADR